MPKVLNIRDRGIESTSVRIDRKTKWGNPFIIGLDGTREEIVAKYRAYIKNLVKNNVGVGADLEELRGKDLVCWCAPLPCHGDVLLELANAEQ